MLPINLKSNTSFLLNKKGIQGRKIKILHNSADKDDKKKLPSSGSIEPIHSNANQSAMSIESSELSETENSSEESNSLKTEKAADYPLTTI